MGKRIDLHLHSIFSDGRLKPGKLIRECKKLGLKIVAVTDHDSVGGVSWAMNVASKCGVVVIPGIEISCCGLDGKEEHLIGLNVKHEDPKLVDFIETSRIRREEQTREKLESLQKKGADITFKEVMKQCYGSVCSSHIAYALMAKPNYMDILAELGAANINEFFKKFLHENSHRHIKKPLPKIEDAIRLIKDIEGISIWAHPLWRGSDLDKITETTAILHELGLDGIEVHYPLHGKRESRNLYRIAKRFSMIGTCGSDFHSYDSPILNRIGKVRFFGLGLNLPIEISNGLL